MFMRTNVRKSHNYIYILFLRVRLFSIIKDKRGVLERECHTLYIHYTHSYQSGCHTDLQKRIFTCIQTGVSHLNVHNKFRTAQIEGNRRKNKDRGLRCLHVKSVHDVGKIGQKKGLEISSNRLYAPQLSKIFLVKNHASNIKYFTVVSSTIQYLYMSLNRSLLNINEFPSLQP